MGELMNYFLKFTILKVSNKADWQEKLSFVIFGFLKYMSVPDTTMGVFLKCWNKDTHNKINKKLLPHIPQISPKCVIAISVKWTCMIKITATYHKFQHMSYLTAENSLLSKLMKW